jgi:K+-transporting ATPase KdpF subunit
MFKNNMKMNATILLTVSKPIETGPPLGYLIGILVAVLVFGFLIYSLVKPEKF